MYHSTIPKLNDAESKDFYTALVVLYFVVLSLDTVPAVMFDTPSRYLNTHITRLSKEFLYVSNTTVVNIKMTIWEQNSRSERYQQYNWICFICMYRYYITRDSVFSTKMQERLKDAEGAWS